MTYSRRWLVLFSVLGLFAVGFVFANRGPTPEQLAHGKMLFEHEWTVNDELAGDGDGLGPVFNAESCVACHFQGGVGGGGPNQHNVRAFQVVPVGSRSEVASGVVHSNAVFDDLRENDLQVKALFPTVMNRAPISSSSGGSCGLAYTYQPPDFDPVLFDMLNTPALFGVGLIDNLSLARARLHGAKRAISAVSASLDGDMSQTLAGRLRGPFGWKGQFNTLEEFVAAACAMEVGLTNPMKSQPIPGAYQTDEDAKWDMDRQQLRDLVSFVASLPAPKQVLPTDPKLREVVIQGEQVFARIGCAECHLPNLGDIQGLYSDLRLYDITLDSEYGTGDEDEFRMPSGHVAPDEWKTPPLWGVADSAPYFHDGGSATLEEAVLRHAGDAAKSKSQYSKTSDFDRRALLAFLESLRAPKMP